jgi:hypothetical protein
MRDRHRPRVCGSCHGPMARQEGTCWRCGARWAAERPTTPLRRPVPVGLTMADAAGLDAEDWVNEAGPAAPDRAVAAATP